MLPCAFFWHAVETARMKQATITALAAIVASDRPKTQSDKEALLRALGLDDGGGASPAPVRDRLLTFREAAALLGRTPRCVHKLAKGGHLRKGMFPGHKRNGGILQSSVDELLAGMGGQEVVG